MTARRQSVGVVLALSLVLCASCFARVSGAAAVTLPDGRAYELVSRITEAGGESALNGATPFFKASSEDGAVVDWEALGACCGASSGAINSYQSVRTPSGWVPRAISPEPHEPLTGFEELQEAVAWNSDLSQTLFSTTASYASGDDRPKGSGGSDLYLRSASGALEWISRGPLGGTGPDATNFAGATPGFGEIVFGTAEGLTANATGLGPQKWARYLYARNVQQETTSLIDVDDSGNLLTPYGASLGNAGPPREGLISFGFRGSTTHAVSADGTKIFFETPPDEVSEPPEGVEPHLYMRDLADATTTPLDDPGASGSASYEGAAADGSLAFFTSDEGLDGASTAKELYEFNTTSAQIGQASPMSSAALGGGSGILGVTAIANDGSRVFFVADGVLAANVDSAGHPAVAGQPNLYSYDTHSAETVFVTPLAVPDVSNCKPTCAGGEAKSLVGPTDIFRPAYPSRDGSVLVFTSSGDLTGEAHAPSTTLRYGAYAEEHTIGVESSAGFQVNSTVEVGTGEEGELETVEKIDSPTEITLSEYGPALSRGFVDEHPGGTSVVQLNAEVYRYQASDGALRCLSCTSPGVLSSAGATLGEAGGGSYAPPGYAPQMSEDGSRIFFDSPDPLAEGAGEAVTGRVVTDPADVYEWDDGTVRLIADASDNGAVFDGTTPSGDDVFFTTRSRLVASALVGNNHIYDARVGGGFATEVPAPAPCGEEACRPLAPTATSSPPPASATLDEASPVAGGEASPPKFSVARVTAQQLAKLARGGALVLSVSATAPSTVLATATAKLHGKQSRVAQAATTLGSSGKATLSLRLSKAARTELSRRGELALRISVSYAKTGAIESAQLKLTDLAKRPAAGGSAHDG